MNQRAAVPWIVGGLLGVLLMRKTSTQPTDPRIALERPPATSLARTANMGFLQPKFRAKVEELIRRVNAQGYDAIVFETFRTRARNEQLSRKGTGVKPRADGTIPIGMHELGLAVDIISKAKKWDAPKDFWAAIGAAADELGLEWGGNWTRVDKPHVQAVAPGGQANARSRFQRYGYDGVEV